MKVGQRWWHVPSQRAMVVESVHGGQVRGREHDGGTNRWENDDQKMREFGWQLLAPDQVYQHGGELFVTFDATPRLRNLRTGLTITPRVPFKYLGEMPQVGQVWVGKSTEGMKMVTGFDKGWVKIEFWWSDRTHKGEVPLDIFLQNHTLRAEPNYIFATGHKDPLNVNAADRRFTAAEVGTAAHARREDALTLMSAKQHAWERFKNYCMADVEAEAKVRDSVGLYMAPDGTVWRLLSSAENTRTVLLNSDRTARVMKLDTFNTEYRPLPLPGQLWAKGSRYVTVDRVEDGRVYYTDGSSGLRRFLNEYCRVAFKQDVLVLDFANLGKITNDPLLTGLKAAHEYGTTLPLPPRPFITAKSAQGKLRELALGYKFGKQGLKDFGAQVQRYGRMLRPTPTTEGMPCPLNTSTLNRLNTGNVLDNWTQYRNIIGAKIRYANQRIKELSKPPAEPLSFSDLTSQRVPEPRFKECAEAALSGFYFDLKAVRMDGDTRMEFTSKEEFIEFCRAVAPL